MIELSDEQVFDHIVARHLLPEGRCQECGCLRGLFLVRGQYFRLCPRCVQIRITLADLQLGGIPPDIEALRQEAIQEMRMQWRRKVESVLVDRSHVWTCHRCGDRMTRFEARLIPSKDESEAEDHQKLCYAGFPVCFGPTCYPRATPATLKLDSDWRKPILFWRGHQKGTGISSRIVG